MTWIGRMLCRVLFDAVLIVIGLAMMPFVAVVMAGNALFGGLRWLELQAVYDGDEDARDRDRWKSGW